MEYRLCVLCAKERLTDDLLHKAWVCGGACGHAEIVVHVFRRLLQRHADSVEARGAGSPIVVGKAPYSSQSSASRALARYFVTRIRSVSTFNWGPPR